jgi:hypothetical protein
MRALMVVKVEIAFQCWEEIESGGEVAGVDEFVLERAPQPFDENIGLSRQLRPMRAI